MENCENCQKLAGEIEEKDSRIEELEGNNEESDNLVADLRSDIDEAIDRLKNNL